MNTIQLTVALEAGEPPKNFRIFKAGDNETSKGTFVFDKAAADAVMAAFVDQGMDRLPIDFDHGMFRRVTPDSSIAAGWFVPKVVNGELLATGVEWTPRATQMLRDREFRFISPAFAADGDSVIQKLLNVAITNLPATKNLIPLVANQQQHAPSMGTKERESMQKLLGRLNAKDEAEALTIVTGWETTSAELLGITNTTSLADALSAAKAGAEAMVSLVTLSAKLEALEHEAEEAKRADLIAKLPPSMRTGAVSKLPVTALSAVVEELDGAFPGDKGKAKATGNGAKVVRLNAGDRQMIQQMNVSEADYIKRLELEAAESEAG